MVTRIQKFIVVQQVGNQGDTYDWMTSKDTQETKQIF